MPAVVHDGRLDVLGANAPARDLLGLRPGVNLARMAFLSPAVRREGEEWLELCATVAGALRAAVDDRPDDDALAGIVGELSARSADFARVWAQWPEPRWSGIIRCGPVGRPPLSLHYVVLHPPGFPGRSVIVWRGADAHSRARMLRRE